MTADRAVWWLAAPMFALAAMPATAMAQVNDAEVKAEIADLKRMIATLQARLDVVERAAEAPKQQPAAEGWLNKAS